MTQNLPSRTRVGGFVGTTQSLGPCSSVSTGFSRSHPKFTPKAPMTSRREKLQQMLQDNPDDPFLLYGLAMEEQSQGNWDRALQMFERVLAVDPQSVAAYFQQGQILARLGRVDEARSALEAGIAVARGQLYHA